jgi:transcriptional regulator with XRE-family HTH domain
MSVKETFSVDRPQTLGQVIRTRRQEMGLTQEELAHRIGHGVRQAEVSRLEHDRVTLPRRRRLEQIAQALNYSVGELLARSGWAGADEALQQPSPAAIQTGAANAVFDPNAKSRPGDPDTLGVAISDLAAAIARARETMQHSARILESVRSSVECVDENDSA